MTYFKIYAQALFIYVCLLFVAVNLTGHKGRVDMSNFELLKVLGTGGKTFKLAYINY